MTGTMKGSFTKRGRQCDVTLTKTHLKCCMKTNFGSNVNLTISLQDVLAVQTQSRDSSSANNSIVIHYAGTKKNSKALTWEKLVLSGTQELCKDLYNIFSQQLTERLRPKHYLVVINPHSGKKTGNRIFHKKVAPLLKTCGAIFKVYVTRGPQDAKTAFQDVDLSELDGVLVVGGDGFYAEVLTALAVKQHNIAGSNPDDPDATLKPFPCPIGMLPGGSGNYLIMYLHGCVDPINSTIKILLGQTTSTNMVSIHQDTKLEGYGGLILGFGLLGDIMYLCERNRWMGNIRYKVLPIKAIFKRRLITSQVEFQKEGDGEWHSISGDYYAVETCLVDLVDNGERLVPTFGGPALTLHVTSACPLGNHIKQLTKVAEWQTGAYDFDFVKSEQVNKIRVTMENTVTSETGEVTLPNDYYMNLDGEALIINKSNFTISLHTGVATLFG